MVTLDVDAHLVQTAKREALVCYEEYQHACTFPEPISATGPHSRARCLTWPAFSSLDGLLQPGRPCQGQRDAD